MEDMSTTEFDFIIDGRYYKVSDEKVTKESIDITRFMSWNRNWSTISMLLDEGKEPKNLHTTLKTLEAVIEDVTPTSILASRVVDKLSNKEPIKTPFFSYKKTIWEVKDLKEKGDKVFSLIAEETISNKELTRRADELLTREYVK